MSTSCFEEPLNFGGAKLTEGKKYEIELTDIVKDEKVVAYNSNFTGKGVIGKVYDNLDGDKKALVDNTPAEMWEARDGKPATEKPKFVNRITFQFREPETDTKFMYDAQFDMTLDNFPTKKLREFVTRATGMSIQGDEGFAWKDLFKKGDRFVAIVTRKDNFFRLNVDSIMKAELSGPVAVGDVSNLSPDAQALYNYIKSNLVGQKFKSVVEVYPTGAGGAIVSDAAGDAYVKTANAWAEIRQSGISYSTDGETFGGF